MSETLPYLSTPGTITTVLSKIQPAVTPDKFDRNFLEDTLGIKGGSYRAFIPFAKRIGLLTQEGAPTDLYKRFRTEGHESTAIAEAIRTGYRPLFLSDERANALGQSEFKALVIRVTGYEASSSSLSQVIACFNKLKEWAKFDGKHTAAIATEQAAAETGKGEKPVKKGGLSISYTINLNLPESSDPKVFAAIFKALREHMLTEDQ
jgi:hypothetical protein